MGLGGCVMKKVLLALVCAGMVLGTTVANADRDERYGYGGAPHGEGGGWHSGIRARIHEAQERIERGVEQGRLSHRDAHRFREELRGIEETFVRMREDGPLDYEEQGRIHRALGRLNAEISMEKREHDRY